MHSSLSQWRGVSRAPTFTASNSGPTVDAGSDNAGVYMFAGTGRSMLASPVISVSTNHCLRFRVHFRGVPVGRLTVSQTEKNNIYIVFENVLLTGAQRQCFVIHHASFTAASNWLMEFSRVSGNDVIVC